MNVTKVIMGACRTGKTYKILKELKNNPGSILIVINKMEKVRLINQYNIKAERIFTIDEIVRGQALKGKRELEYLPKMPTLIEAKENLKIPKSEIYKIHLLIDNIDLILEYLLDHPVTVISLNGKEYTNEA